MCNVKGTDGTFGSEALPSNLGPTVIKEWNINITLISNRVISDKFYFSYPPPLPPNDFLGTHHNCAINFDITQVIAPLHIYCLQCIHSKFAFLPMLKCFGFEWHGLWFQGYLYESGKLHWRMLCKNIEYNRDSEIERDIFCEGWRIVTPSARCTCTVDIAQYRMVYIGHCTINVEYQRLMFLLKKKLLLEWLNGLLVCFTHSMGMK